MAEMASRRRLSPEALPPSARANGSDNFPVRVSGRNRAKISGQDPEYSLQNVGFGFSLSHLPTFCELKIMPVSSQ
jgi:hypothetical protein